MTKNKILKPIFFLLVAFVSSVVCFDEVDAAIYKGYSVFYDTLVNYNFFISGGGSNICRCTNNNSNNNGYSNSLFNDYSQGKDYIKGNDYIYGNGFNNTVNSSLYEKFENNNCGCSDNFKPIKSFCDDFSNIIKLIDDSEENDRYLSIELASDLSEYYMKQSYGHMSSWAVKQQIRKISDEVITGLCDVLAKSPVQYSNYDYVPDNDVETEGFEGPYFNNTECSGNSSNVKLNITDNVGNYSHNSNAIKGFGNIVSKATYPGGPYETKIGFSASYSYTYIERYDCIHKQYLHGKAQADTCAGSIGGQVDPGPPVGWNAHPEYLLLTENIVGAETKRMNFELGSSSELSYGGIASSSGGYTGGTNGIGSGSGTALENFNMTQALQEAAAENGIVFGTDSSPEEFAQGEGSIYTQNEDGSWSKAYSKFFPVSGTDSWTSQESSYCPHTDSVDVESYAGSVAVSAQYADTYDVDYSKDVSCSLVTTKEGSCCYSTGTGDNYICHSKYQYYEVECSFAIIGDYINYYRPDYVTKSDSISGWYVLEESSPNETRFESDNVKYIPVDTLTGNYKYIVTADPTWEALYGTRYCDLYVNIPSDTSCSNGECVDCIGVGCIPVKPCTEGEDCGYHWSEFLYFRNVDEYDLFPGGRQSGRNWYQYTSVLSKVPTTQKQSMYTIKLSAADMKNIAKNTDASDYVGLNLRGNLNNTSPAYYLPINSYGNYDYNHDKNYASLDLLRSYGADITVREDVIINRNKELIRAGYNKYIIK